MRMSQPLHHKRYNAPTLGMLEWSAAMSGGVPASRVRVWRANIGVVS